MTGTLQGYKRNVNEAPPESEQKVISQPSPDENADSISLNTLPGTKTAITMRP